MNGVTQERAERRVNVSDRAGRREWFGLAIIALPCLLYSMDFTVLHLAVPSLVADLRPTSAQLLWIVDIYGFLLAGVLVAMGVLGDRIGRRKLLLIGAALFGLASILTAMAPTAEWLIAARALLGLAAATLAPSTLSLIRNMFVDPKQRTVAVGVWVASFSAGAAIGPLVGGALLVHFWWGSVFLIAVPGMLLLVALGPWLLPEYRDPNPGRLDVTSAALSLAAVLGVVYGVKQIAAGEPGVAAIVAIVGGLAVAGVFLRRQQMIENPFVDLSLFRSSAFGRMLVVYTMIFFVNFVAFLFITQYLQLVLGMSALEAGLWTLPWGCAFVVGSLAAPAIAARTGPAVLVAGGLSLAALGFFALTQIELGLAVIVIGSTLFSLGLAPAIALTTDLIIGTVPPSRAGTASGLSETGSELGGALGVALIGSAATALYRGTLSGDLPQGLAQHHVDAALDTLGGALMVAEAHQDTIGGRLASTARDAFTNSVVLGFILCGVTMLAAAALTVSALRKHDRTEDKAHSEQHTA
jgi:MFS transporter, DHA2 family, multidrug resistance protein